MNTRHWIINVLAVGVSTAAGLLPAYPQPIRPGDTPESVVRELGKPKGRISSGAYEVYTYERGKVEFVSNLVSSIDLISAEQLEEQRIEQEKRRQEEIRRQAEAAQLAREAQERRRLEGQKIMTDRLADTAFRTQSAGDQLAYWDLFKTHYPEVEIGSVYEAVFRQHQTEVAQAQIRLQLAELQQRTAAAEARAARAEQAARDAEEAYYWSRPVTYIPLPMPPHPPPPSRQPICTMTQTAPVKSTYMLPPRPGPAPHRLPAARLHQAASPPIATGLTSRAKSGIISQ